LTGFRSTASPLPRRRRLVAALLAAACLSFAEGCRQETPPPPPAKIDYAQELPPGTLALRKLPPERYPDFSAMGTDPAALAKAIGYSLDYLKHPSSRSFFPYLDITHDRAVATLTDLGRLAGRGPGVRWNDEIRARYDVYQSVGAAAPAGASTAGGSGVDGSGVDGSGVDGSGVGLSDVGPSPLGGRYTGQVLFTGYFTPTYDASLTRGGPYQWPLYKKPLDLVADETGEGVYRRQLSAGSAAAPAGSPDLAPLAERRYWTRAEIEQGHKLADQELVWLTSRWEAYVVTIQGSARLRLPDGKIYEVGFAGTNGHAYPEPGKAPGDRMVADGVIPKDQRTLQGMGRYFAAHPEAMDRYLLLNPRTTFFAERPGGPFGKLNVPVTAFASIATDKQVYPRAMPAYVVTRTAMFGPLHRDVTMSQAAGGEPRESVAFRGLMLDQDAGGAIRSAGRCDIYMGVGAAAEQQAGRQMSVGRLYYLAIKPEFAGK
jgi:membrane-bound lytic murein transglycosylase A